MNYKILLQFFIIFFLPFNSYSQMGSSGLPGASPEELMAESLQQAIGLEKLPEVSNIINRDTIFIEVYDLISGPDSLPDEVLTRMLPRHIDRWPIKSNINNDLKKRDENFHYLKIFIERDDSILIVKILNQPNFTDFIDRGGLTMEFEFEKGVCKLLKLFRWYG